MIEKAIAYINQHYAESLTLDTLAGELQISKFYLSKKFKSETGYSFLNYLTAVRMKHAKELLQSQSVTTTCYDVGYESLSHFSTTFQKFTGLNPIAFKKMLTREQARHSLHSGSDLSNRYGGRLVMPFAQQYLEEALKIFSAIGSQEFGALESLADRCAAALRGGHTVYAEINEGGCACAEETRLDRPGNPNLLQAINRYSRRHAFDPEKKAIHILPDNRFANAGLYERIQPGDVFITGFPSPTAQQLKQKGVYVGGVGLAIFPNRYVPWQKVEKTVFELTIEDIANEIVYTHVPWQNGLVHIPEIPVVPFAPGSGLADILIHWMLTAETAGKLHNSPYSLGRQYLKAVVDAMGNLRQSFAPLGRIGARMAERVINGGRIYVSGDRLINRELIWRASGLMGIYPLDCGRVTAADVALIGAPFPEAAVLQPLLQRLQRIGVYRVLLVPDTRRPEITALHRLADEVVSLPSPSLSLQQAENRPIPPCPTHGLILIAGAWMVLSAYLQEMVCRGHPPYVFIGVDVAGGKPYDDAIYPFFLERGF